jgi:hypothetical protein
MSAGETQCLPGKGCSSRLLFISVAIAMQTALHSRQACAIFPRQADAVKRNELNNLSFKTVHYGRF